MYDSMMFMYDSIFILSFSKIHSKKQQSKTLRRTKKDKTKSFERKKEKKHNKNCRLSFFNIYSISFNSCCDSVIPHKRAKMNWKKKLNWVSMKRRKVKTAKEQKNIFSFFIFNILLCEIRSNAIHVSFYISLLLEICKLIWVHCHICYFFLFVFLFILCSQSK